MPLEATLNLIYTMGNNDMDEGEFVKWGRHCRHLLYKVLNYCKTIDLGNICKLIEKILF
jgi:hypothetical protein